MKKKYILIDLDGTIADSSEGIYKSVSYALENMGIHNEPLERLSRFIGPPLYDSFTEFYGFDHEEALRAIGFYRERYHEKGVYESKLYDGIPELLKLLRVNGMKTVVATSKPEIPARTMLESLGITELFDFIAGSTFDLSRRSKSDVLRYAIAELGIDIDDAVMVGDTKYDVLGAKEFSLATIGVTYGFGTRNELNRAGADIVVDTVEEIGKELLKE